MNWFDAVDVLPRLGVPAHADSTSIVAAAIGPSQMWVQTLLRSPVGKDTIKDVYLVDATGAGHQQFNGVFVLKTSRMFLRAAPAVVCKAHDDWDSYVAGTATVVTPVMVDTENGYFRFRPEDIDGKVVSIEYDCGFNDKSELAAAAPELVEAATAYLPTVLRFSQVENVDDSNYRTVVENARTHAREILGRWLNVKVPLAIRPL